MEDVIKYYYAIDGDDIGKKLEECVLKNNLVALKDFSIRVKSALLKIRQYMCSQGCEIVFCEGDSLLACSDFPVDLSMQLLTHNDISFSAGIGTSSALALLALKKAKGLGKKRIEVFVGEPK